VTELIGRTVLVTGASKGIGAQIVRALGAAGAHVIAHYNRDDEGARAAAAGLPAERVLLAQADLAEPTASRRLWQHAVRWRGQVDVLVNNAAVLAESPLDASDDEWDSVWALTYAVNVAGPMALNREAVRHFRCRGGGVLITMSSWAAQRGSANPDLVAYSASKAAIKAATQTLARAHAAEGLLCYVIAPGMVRTQMSEIATARVGGEAGTSADLAMGSWVPPAEVADLVVFLASGTRRHLSGATFDVNGATYIR
jgi:NAD(P)-dependent dehydrogenase (short-subunit alcohol dehydrogenase family)